MQCVYPICWQVKSIRKRNTHENKMRNKLHSNKNKIWCEMPSRQSWEKARTIYYAVFCVRTHHIFFEQYICFWKTKQNFIFDLTWHCILISYHFYIIMHDCTCALWLMMAIPCIMDHKRMIETSKKRKFCFVCIKFTVHGAMTSKVHKR